LTGGGTTVTFDAYESWLGIPANRRPPTLYDLLRLAPHESNPAVIDQAAVRRMSKVRQHQLGPHSDLSQEILSQLARARLILMDPDRRADYNAKHGARGHRKVPESAVPVIVASDELTGTRSGLAENAPEVFGSLALADRIGDKKSLESNLHARMSLWIRGLIVGAVIASHVEIFAAFFYYVLRPPRPNATPIEVVHFATPESVPTPNPVPTPFRATRPPTRTGPLRLPMVELEEAAVAGEATS
jgi:hypothetical protein